MPVKIGEVRSMHKDLGTYKLATAARVGYASLITGLLLATISTWLHSEGIDLPWLKNFNVGKEFLVICIGHFLFLMNSDSFYETYFVVWETKSIDRFASIVLWLLHSVTLALTYLRPRFWLVFIGLLLLAVHFKNRLSRRNQPADSPARAILDRWVPRSLAHAAMASFLGLIVAAISSPEFYGSFLHVNASNPDVRKIVRFNELIIDLAVVVPFALVAFTRVKLVTEDDFPDQEIARYNQEMEKYLTGLETPANNEP